MKIFLILSFFLVTNDCLFAQDPFAIQRFSVQMLGPIEISNLPEKAITRNKIKNEYIYSHNFHRKRKDSTLEQSRVYTYDENGNIKSMLIKPTSQNVVKSILYTFTFNEKGFLLTENSIQSPNRSKPFENLMNYEYDQSNRLINRYNYNKDTTAVTIYKFEYNNFFQPFKIFKKVDKGDFIPNFDILYDKIGRDSLFNRIMEEKENNFSYQYEYDDSTHRKSMWLINRQGRNLKEETFYNNKNQLIKFISVGKDPEEEIITKYTFNNDGTLFTETKYNNNKAIGYICHYYQK